MLSKITLSQRVFIVFLIAIHAGYFISALILNHIYTPDSPEYLLDAINIKEHFTSYCGNWNEVKISGLYSLRTPFYGIFIMLAKSIINSDFFVIFIQNIFSLASCLFISKLFRGTHYTSISNLFILCSLLFFPVYLIMVNSIMSDIFLMAWLVLALAFFIQYIKNKKSTWMLFYNLALAAAVMTKPVMMFFWLPNIFITLYFFVRLRQKPLLFYWCILPLVIFFWSERNKNITGYFHFSSIEMQNILELNAGTVLTIKYDMDSSKTFQHSLIKKADSIPDFAIRSKYIFSTSENIVKDNLLIYTYAHMRGMLNLMLATGRENQMSFFAQEEKAPISIVYEAQKKGFLNGILYYLGNVNIAFLVIGALVALWNVLTLITFILGMFSKNMNATIKIFIYILVVYIVFACGPGGYARFKTSIIPFLLYTFPFGWEVLKKIFKKNAVQS